MNTSEVLNKAADLIEERGWGTGEWYYGDDSVPLCTEGAIQAALGTTDGIYEGNCPAYKAVSEYVGQRYLFSWNDRLTSAHNGWVGGSRESAYEHGKQTVIAVLRAAALIEAAKENPSAAKESAAVQVPAEVVA